jgi:L-iditol 2-dehydrogenase
VGDVRLEQRPIPTPGSGQVLVRVQRVGVCGSDIHYFTHGRIGRFVVEKPMILGHESAGAIVALGPDVDSRRMGQRVAIEPGYTCGKCGLCRSGRYNLCPDVVFMATPPYDGAFCEYVAWPAEYCFPLPDNLSYEDGAMMEPLAVGLWAAERGNVRPGDAVAVFGCGTIGLLTIEAARAAGAAVIIAVDIQDFRLNHARRLGATHSLNDREGQALAQIRAITAALQGCALEAAGVDAAFETAGSLITTRNVLAAPRPGGVAVLVGLPPDRLVELDIVSAASREIDIRGQFRYANRYPRGIALAASGQIDVASLVTHHFPLDRAQDALEFADRHKNEALKVIVDTAV